MKPFTRKTADLDTALQKATAVRLNEIYGHPAEPFEVVVDLTDPAEHDRLLQALGIAQVTDGTCWCRGELDLEFLDRAGQSLTTVTLHHGALLRWRGWGGDALLANNRSLLQWLDDHGQPGPSRRAGEQLARQASAQAEADDWFASVPPPLASLTDSMVNMSPWVGQDWLKAEAGERLRRAVPDGVRRVLLLLEWLPAGSGKFSGYPVHEGFPQLLLGEVPVAEIVAALEDPGAGPRHDLGAVRHLLGWDGRPDEDLRALPPAIRERMRSAARSAADPAWAMRADELLP